ncbi:unnamed protein product [Rotaria sp. Silwood2]|nr:unnamed protein product [Rotaria sp. Silwood2]
MLSIISPAKSQNFLLPIIDMPSTPPHFINETRYILQICQNLSQNQIKQLMHVSDKIAALNYKRFQDFDNQITKQAIFAYNGDVYDNIVKSNDVDHENSKRLEEAIEKVSSSNDKHGFEGEEKMNVIKKLPLKSESNQELSYISRFIMENIIDYLKFLGRFNIQFFQTIGPSINKYVNIILLFMHDESHLGNPHLRATLAEALETILPPKQHGNSRTLNSSFAETIFKEHSLIEHLLRVLLHVFVLIELTG